MINPRVLFSRLVPPDYQPLLSCISPSTFSVIDWKKNLSDAPVLAKRIATGQGKEELQRKLRSHIPKSINLIHGDEAFFNRTTPLNPEQGEQVLGLYFSQFKSDDGIFLDLRASSFGLSSQGHILWRPNNLWKRLDPEFRKGMLSIYEGYYLDRPKLFRQGLLQAGLIKDHFASKLVSQVEDMLISHIGGDTSCYMFKVSHFTNSFEKLFQFLIKEKIILHSDFLYLGLYLGGLYLHLESLGRTYDVRRAFIES
jgi:hypothetical protein